MLENSFVIAAISCNKDVLGTLRGCVLFFKRKSYKNESVAWLVFLSVST